MRASTTDDNAADNDLDAKDVPFIYGAILRIESEINVANNAGFLFGSEPQKSGA